MFFCACTDCALTLTNCCLCSAALSFKVLDKLTLCFSFVASDRKVIGQSFDRAIENPLVRLPDCANCTNTPSSRSSQLRKQRTSQTLSFRARRSTTLLWLECKNGTLYKIDVENRACQPPSPCENWDHDPGRVWKRWSMCHA